MLGRRASRLAPQPAPYRHYARENRPRITLRRDGDIAPYRHYARASRCAVQLRRHYARAIRPRTGFQIAPPAHHLPAITHAQFARARGTRNTRSDSWSLCSYTTRPFVLCAPLCLKQPRRRATAWCVTSHLAPLAVRPPCPTLLSRCGRARCPHRAAPSRCHAPRCRPHNYPRALPCGVMVARRGSRLAPYRHHTCASRGAVPLRTAITPAKFARNARVSSPRPVGNPKSPVAARHLFGCRTSRPAPC